MAAEEFTFAQELQLDRIYEKMFDVCKTICDEFDSADDGDNAFVMRMADLLAEDILHELPAVAVARQDVFGAAGLLCDQCHIYHPFKGKWSVVRHFNGVIPSE